MASWVNVYLKNLTDEELTHEILPGKNHGVWMLGHLIASDDDLSLYLGKGPRLYPEYEGVFTQGSRLKPAGEYPAPSVLREQWYNVVEKNKKIYSELKDEELLQPHEMLKGKIGDDYFKTKGNVAINWLLHQLYVTGQLSVLRLACGKPGLV
jgi:hypothetical protein